MRRTTPDPEGRARTSRSVLLPARREPDGAPRWLRRLGFALSMVALVAALPVLARMGWKHALAAGDEASAASSADVAAPGYRAMVSPTPTMLLVHRSPAAELAGVSMLAQVGDDSSAVLLIPTSLVVDAESGRGRTLASVFVAGGVDEVAAAVARALHIGFAQVVALDAADWEAAAAGHTVVLENPDQLADSDGQVRFEPGRLTLQAQDLEPYSRLRNAAEEDRGRLFRNDLLWTAWFKSLAKGSPASTRDPFSVMVHAMAKASVVVVELPVVKADAMAASQVEVGVSTNSLAQGVEDSLNREVFYVLDVDPAMALLSTIVPFPSAARPGDRIRVRLLNGIGDQTGALAASAKLVPAGAEITVFGNADRFDYANTMVEFFDETQRNHAVTLAVALGVASPVFNPIADGTVDVSVIVGKDFSSPGAVRKTPLVGPPTSR